MLTYNTVLEAISKQANCCSRQFTGWRGSALSYKQHQQLYLEKEIKPKYFVSKYTDKVIFLFKTITRLKLALVVLSQVLMPSFIFAAHLQEQAPRRSQSLPRLLKLRATALEKKAPSKQQTHTCSCFSHLVLLQAFAGNSRWNTGVSTKKM